MKISKNLSIIVILVFTFFVGLLPANAESIGYLFSKFTDKDPAINKTNDKYETQDIIPIGTMVNVIGEPTGSICGGMYKVKYIKYINDIAQSATGYVCSSVSIFERFDTTHLNEFADFPSSYQTYLSTLKKLYKNAEFIRVDTGIDWSNLVDNQTNAEGKNLIQITSNNRDGWKNPVTYIDGKFKENFPGGGETWFSPSKDIVSYYLDPRNFLNKRYVFQFEQLSFNKDMHNLNGVQNILDKTFMSNTNIKKEITGNEEISYAEAFMEAGSKFNVSPYYLVAKAIQEIGTSGNNEMVTGKYPGFEGYYNFFNICANGNNPLVNGLTCAQGGINKDKTDTGRPWNTPYRAILGGAEFISNGYIKRGQDTGYTQKFNVTTPPYFTNQYMQNIQAAATEASISYSKGISKNSNFNDLPFVFKIPVYIDMPNETVLPNSKLDSSSLPTTPPAPPAPVINYGDVNNDGQITVLDLLYVQRYLLRTMTLNSQQLKAADVSKDGVVNVLDLLMIQKHLLGISFIR